MVGKGVDMESMPKGWTNLIWDSGVDIEPREGFFGGLLDLVRPKYKQARVAHFIVINKEGAMFMSEDGIEWSKN